MLKLPEDVQQRVSALVQFPCTMLLNVVGKDGLSTIFASDGPLDVVRRVELRKLRLPACQRGALTPERICMQLGQLLRECMHPFQNSVMFEATASKLPAPFQYFDAKLSRKPQQVFWLNIRFERRTTANTNEAAELLEVKAEMGLPRTRLLSIATPSAGNSLEELVRLFFLLEAGQSGVQALPGELRLDEDGDDFYRAKLGLVQGKNLFSELSRRGASDARTR